MVLSWVASDVRNPAVYLLSRLCEPVLRPVRRVIPPLAGLDLSPLLDDPSRPTKEAAYTVVARSNDPSVNQSQVMDYLGRSVRTNRWRYTEWDGGRRGAELYDHDNDPHEWQNLASDPQYTATVRQLRALLRADAEPAKPTGSP